MKVVLRVWPLDLHCRPAESETLGRRKAICLLRSPPGQSAACWNVRTSVRATSFFRVIVGRKRTYSFHVLH